MIHIGELAPIWEAIVVAADPLNRFFLQQAIVLSGGLFDSTKINDCFMPSLSENRYSEVSFGAKVGLVSSYLGAVREAFESHRAIIA